MAKIQKGFALSAAIIGTLCLLFGVATSICAWVLASKADFSFTTTEGYSTETKSFGTYWWGGIGFAVPGILGIVAGCTRNTVAMVFYLIFNLICILCSMAVSILVALVVVLWAVVNNLYQNGDCNDLMGSCYCKDYDNTYVMHNVPCSNIDGIQVVLIAIIAMSSISTLLAFIASYISCCALCNQEHEHPTVIIQPGPGAYQAPIMVQSHGNPTMVVGGYQPGVFQQGPYIQGGYNQQQIPPAYTQQQYPTNDKVNLIKNEVV